MTVTVGRNEPCPCGSGKKYKKCCEKNNAVSIETLVNEELIGLEEELIEHFVQYYLTSFNRFFLYEKANFPHLAEFENEPFSIMDQVYHWYIFTQEAQDGKTVAEEFIDRRLPTVQRQRTKDVFKSWKDYTIVVGTVSHCMGENLEVTDALTGETYSIIEPEHQFDVDHTKGQMVIGIKIGKLFFGIDHDFPLHLAEAQKAWVAEDFAKSGEKDEQEYLKKNFMKVAEAFQKMKNEEGDRLVKLTPEQEEVAEELEAYLNSLEVEPDDMAVPAGLAVWEIFCDNANPKIQNPNIYVGAIYYLLSQQNFGLEKRSQKLVAEIFETSPGSISKRSKEIAAVLDEVGFKF
ncbi:YecA family protein [Falsibacillus pallidus]|uniref:SEC-C motif-containing protein n=1 Tax=Falsibacillus pallidus TaxID=493781 RepID=A0A370GAL8_9BACI|nr:SEC-C metal-binding domain-containing protein [Falsibacillus pallidus]RDI40099.1 SEC-C motif-containing protein [Falsibacillus pallidus]